MNINKTGYLKGSKTKDNDYNIIPSGNITTRNMAFPIFANGKLLLPDTGDYKFNTDAVLEVPAFYKGRHMKKNMKFKKKQKESDDESSNKFQAGGTIAQDGLNGQNLMGALPNAGNLATSLLASRGTYKGTAAPDENFAAVGNDTLAGGKLGMQIGGPLGAGIGAGAAGLLGLTKTIIDFDKDKKDWTNNLKTSRAENKLDYDRTHQPYGTRGYMQGTPNEQVYSLFEGGMPTGEKKKMINNQTAITDAQVSHGSVSLSKQNGGSIPTDLGELFDRAMEESGGDEEKAQALVQQYQEHPEMTKGKKKPHLKKKQNA